MILTCNECEWSFNINSALINDGGSDVRCSKCGNIWRAYPDREGDAVSEITELPGPEPDPDFEDEEDVLPDLEGLLDFDEEPPAVSVAPEEEDRAEATSEDTDDRDCIDLSDLEELVASDTLPPITDLAKDHHAPEEADPGYSSDGEEETGLFELEGAPDAAKEIDFSDLSDIFEQEEGLLPEFEQEQDAEPELILPIDSEPEDREDPTAAVDTVPESEENEQIDINILVEGESDSPGSTADTVEPADGELEPDKSAADNDSELQIFLGPGGELEEARDNGISDLTKSEVETGSPTDTPESSTGGFDTEDIPNTDNPDNETHEIELDYPAPATEKIGRGKRVVSLFSILLFSLVGLIAAFVYNGNTLLHDRSNFRVNFRIPFISDLFDAGEPDPAGNIRITPLEPTVAGRFIDNRETGELFVITGHVRNDYDHPRSNIRVIAKLFTESNIQVKAASVYCGSILSDTELSALDIATIKSTPGAVPGSSIEDLTVGTGVLVPFMIVFHNLPGNLDEYSVQVLESSRTPARNIIIRGKIEKDMKGT